MTLPVLVVVASGAAWFAWSPRAGSPDSGEDARDVAELPSLPILAAPRPTRRVSLDEGCVSAECHADFASAPHVHPTSAQRQCALCHEDDAGDHTYPLRADQESLCLECHDSRAFPSEPHGARRREGCLSCHDAHLSALPHLLAEGSVAATCRRCHAEEERLFGHSLYEQGHCTVCHDPHGNDVAGLLRGGPDAAHCGLCHEDLVASFDQPSIQKSHGGLSHGCLTCHTPHTANHAHLLSQPAVDQCLACHESDIAFDEAVVGHDAVLLGHRCLACHDPHASPSPMMLRERQATVCLECHRDPLIAQDGREIPSMSSTLLDSTSTHGPVRTSDCSACHSVHGAQHERLLKLSAPVNLAGAMDLRNYTLCFGCHDPALVLEESTEIATQFRNGSVNLHHLHVSKDPNGRSCSSCHAVHGSPQPRLIAVETSFAGSDWRMPIEFALTPDGGRCAPGCHEALSYSRTATAISPKHDRKGEGR
ncbi:MAG: hypothetical protein KDC38_02605 [Planctomycetes bacterium]|nr:hypothetical protein [Planctomycetota bacterium]